MKHIPVTGPHTAKAQADIEALTRRIEDMDALDASNPAKFADDLGEILSDLAREVFVLAYLLDQKEQQ